MASLWSSSTTLPMRSRSPSGLHATIGDLALCTGLDYEPVRAVGHDRRGRGLVGDGLVSGMALVGAVAPGCVAASRSFREVLEWTASGRAADLVAAENFTDASTRTHQMHTLDKRAAASQRRRFRAASVRPAVLEFDVSPRAEVLIDSVAKGTTPPLKRLELAPGAHAVEIRASGYPPLRIGVSLEATQVMTIKRTFTRPRKARGTIENLRRKFGF